jgi:gamma-glutamylcyclotransferase (GGCT)/AIG2-like uncharacterized protein YtfP
MSENVFAYGSNMCSGRFRHYRVNPQGEGLSAVLSDYRLRFNKLSKDGSAKANVEPYATGQVRGVIYAIPDGDLQVLDAGEVGYRRTKMQMQTHEGDITEAWIYIASEPSDDPDLRPYTWFRRFLVMVRGSTPCLLNTLRSWSGLRPYRTQKANATAKCGRWPPES